MFKTVFCLKGTTWELKGVKLYSAQFNTAAKMQKLDGQGSKPIFERIMKNTEYWWINCQCNYCDNNIKAVVSHRYHIKKTTELNLVGYHI